MGSTTFFGQPSFFGVASLPAFFAVLFFTYLRGAGRSGFALSSSSSLWTSPAPGSRAAEAVDLFFDLLDILLRWLHKHRGQSYRIAADCLSL